MQFKIDENIHPDAGAMLADAGHDVATVIGQNLRGSPDADIARARQEEQRALITLDKDFGDIRTFPPSEYPGIVVFRLLDQSRTNVVAVMSRLIPGFDTHPLVGKLWIVDERELRIRGNDT